MAQQTHLEAASKPSSAVISNGVLQRKCACGTHASGGECEACSKECQTLQRATRDPELQTRNSDGVPPIVRDVLRSPGQPLDAQTRAFMQPRFGSDFSTVPVSTAALQRSEEALSVGPANDIYEQEAEQIADRVTTGEPKESQWNTGMDFSHVRVHADAKAAESARAVGALAYTVGSDLVFGGGQYAPTTTAGRHLLAHELAHVVQQKSGLSRHLQRASITYRQLTWADFKASVPADSPFGAVTSSGIDVPVWKSKVDITDTKEACEVKKIKATKHTAKLLIEPTEFDKVQATMTQEKSWVRPKYTNPEKHCAGVVTNCETEIAKQVAKATKECKTEVKPCEEAFDKGSTSYSFPVEGINIVASNKAECSTKLVSDCAKAMAPKHLFDLSDHKTQVAKATTKAECSSPKFKEDCTKHYTDWSPRILKHEQGHFDISNVMAGKAQADLKTNSAKFTATATECGKVQANNEAVKQFKALNAPEELSKIAQAWMSLGKQAEQDYDDQTEHGVKLVDQATWIKNIAGGLKTYDLNKPAAPQQNPPQGPAKPGGMATDFDLGKGNRFDATPTRPRRGSDEAGFQR